MSSEQQLVYSILEKITYFYLINIVIIKILSSNFVSKTTKWLFKVIFNTKSVRSHEPFECRMTVSVGS